VPPPSPAVAQLELTIRLRSRRAQLDLTAKEVSQHLGFSANHWSGVENNRTILAADKLQKLGGLFKFSRAEIKELLALHEIARGPRWLDDYHYILDGRDGHLTQYYGLEYGASSIRTFETSIVPGLLQTEDYVRALVAADPDTNDARLRKRMELRMRRQQRLFGPDPIRMVAVVSQAAFMQQIGGPDVLRRQLLHLVDLSDQLDRSILELRVVPFTATQQGLLNTSTLHLLDFPSPHLPTVAFREAVQPLGITDDTDLLELIVVNFSQSLATTLSHAQSIALIRDLAEDLNEDTDT
jgi:transcriptional regulator with XRE-family HTH domain